MEFCDLMGLETMVETISRKIPSKTFKLRVKVTNKLSLFFYS